MHCGAESLPKIAEFSKCLTCGSKMVAWRLFTDEGVNFAMIWFMVTSSVVAL